MHDDGATRWPTGARDPRPRADGAEPAHPPTRAPWRTTCPRSESPSEHDPDAVTDTTTPNDDLHRIDHLGRRRAVGGRVDPHRPGLQPGARRGAERSAAGLAPADVERGRRRSVRRPGPRWRDASLAKRQTGAVHVPRAAQRAQGASSPRSSPPSTARCSPTRSARSPAASRSWSSPAASRTCSRATTPRTSRPASTSTRSGSRSASSASSARSTSRRWCRCGSSRSPSPRQRGRAQAEREGPDRRELDGRAVRREAGLPDGVLNVVHGDKEAVDALLDAPGRASRSRSSARRRSRTTSTRPATEHGKRVQALGGAKNHMLVLPDADLDLAADAAVNAGFGSAGERCMAISAVRRRRRRSPTSWSRRSSERMATLRTGDGTPRLRHGSADHRASTATRSRPTSTSASTTGATLVVDGRDVEVDGDADGFWLGPTLIDKVTHGHRRSTRDEIFGPVLSVVRVDDLRRRRSSSSTRNQYGNGTAIFTNDGGAARALPARGRRSAWSASTCRSRCRWPTTRSAAGRTRCSATRHAYGPDGVHFFTREQGRHLALARPVATAASNLGFPQNE